MTEHPATIVFERYDDIRVALLDPYLSRTFDRRSYDEGNIRDGIVSVSHGNVHRARRVVENAQFRADVLRLYERELFPRVMNELLDLLIDADRVDLFPIGELLSVVLAARRAGIDHGSSLADLRTLVRHVTPSRRAARSSTRRIRTPCVRSSRRRTRSSSGISCGHPGRRAPCSSSVWGGASSRSSSCPTTS